MSTSICLSLLPHCGCNLPGCLQLLQPWLPCHDELCASSLGAKRNSFQPRSSLSAFCRIEEKHNVYTCCGRGFHFYIYREL